MDSNSQNWNQDTNKEKEKLKKELIAAQEEVKILKTKKTPKKDIDLAKKRLKEMLDE